MKVRVIIVGIAAALTIAGSSIALGDSAEHRAPAASAPAAEQPLPKSIVQTERALAKTARVRVRCGNIQCVNGALTALAKAFRHMTGCMSYINVARYPGYVYSNDGGATTFQTTAFDEAEAGDPATKVAIFVC